jgi:hypothetical protein
MDNEGADSLKTCCSAAAALCTHAILAQILVLGGITLLSSPLTQSRLCKVHRRLAPSFLQQGTGIAVVM